jgi:hypothetical protein
MRSNVGIALAMVLGSVLLPGWSSPQPVAQDVPKNGQPESPFACVRTALSPAQRKRHFEELGPQLRARRKSVHELPDGYEFELPSNAMTFQMAAEWVAGERVCCPFFDIELRLVREHGPLLLRLTGREGVKQFIEQDGAAWVKQ